VAQQPKEEDHGAWLEGALPARGVVPSADQIEHADLFGDLERLGLLLCARGQRDADILELGLALVREQEGADPLHLVIGDRVIAQVDRRERSVLREAAEEEYARDLIAREIESAQGAMRAIERRHHVVQL
jgi:hypothetical protein